MTNSQSGRELLNPYSSPGPRYSIVFLTNQNLASARLKTWIEKVPLIAEAVGNLHLFRLISATESTPDARRALSSLGSHRFGCMSEALARYVVGIGENLRRRKLNHWFVLFS